MQLSRNQKKFFNFFRHFWELHKILNTFKKIWAAEMISYRNYRVEKAELLKWTKNLVWEHLSTVKMLKDPKHCLNLHGSIFVIFFDHSERKSAPKTLF